MTGAAAYAWCAASTRVHEERPGLLVALHGLTGSRAQPLALLHGVDAPAFGVLAPDLRAHGDTPLDGPPEAFTPSALAADVVALLRRLGLGDRRICVLGISLGATVALEILRARALPLVGAVLVRPAHATGIPRHLRANLCIAALLREDPATALERLLASDAYLEVAAISPTAAAGLREKVTKPRSAERVMRLEEGSRWTAFGPDEHLPAAVPTLVIGTPLDPLHPLEVAEAWAARIAGAGLVVVPPRDVDPDATAAATRVAIEGFLRGLAVGEPAS